MNSHKKLLIIVTVMLLLLMSAIVINLIINFREYSFNTTLKRANSIAMFVKDGLTAHMVDGIMDKREFFLNNIKNHKNIKDLHVIRSNKLNKQYGKGFLNEQPKDEIDKEVLRTGKMSYLLEEGSGDAMIRVTIPYIASAYEQPNCLSCHDAKEGDVLGAISMEFDIQNERLEGLATVGKIVVINILFLIFALFAINHYFKPIATLFNELGKMVGLANKGDYSKRIDLEFKGEEKKIIDQINNLFEKLESTFDDLKKSLSTFVSSSHITLENPLEESKKIINELSDIYKFKKTIELDANYKVILSRITYIFEEKFHINNYKLYLYHKEKEERTLLFHKGELKNIDCDIVNEDIENCRAFRTNAEVLSVDFNTICQYCTNKEDYEYICIPFDVNNETSIILTFFTNNTSEYNAIQNEISSIKNYLEAAKPVLESKFLMQKLKDSSLKDGLTGLYNRRFLENFIEKFAKQADRSQISYGIMMIDIDYFKMVNDTYGHDIGDIVIKELGFILKTNIRGSDMAIRYGGEEFLILLYNPEEDNVLKIAKTIADRFKAVEFQANNTTFKKTLSIGVSYFPQQAESIWQSIKFADTALYKAKETGRDKVVAFTNEMNENGNQY